MNKREKPDLIIYEGKLLECDSLFELYGSIHNDDWFAILIETIQFYNCMRMGKELSPIPISKADQRTLRRLTKTIELFKKYDPKNMAQIDLDAIGKEHIEATKKGWDEHERTMRIIYNPKNKVAGGDINISSL